jgi:hypothetical protein
MTGSADIQPSELRVDGSVQDQNPPTVVAVPDEGVAPPPSNTHPVSPARVVLTVGCALVAPILYFWFVAHYGVDFFFWDQWSLVPMMHAALHGSLTWHMLWVQHNENRMLFANFLFIGFADLNHFDVRHVLFFSAGLFSVSYFMFLGLYRTYAQRWLSPLWTLLFGVIWFSVADTENALWSFQVAWYMIVFFFMAMLFCLSRRRITVPLLIVAGLFAILASYSSLQGLILWPTGLLIIWWRQRRGTTFWWYGGAWSVVGVIVALLYFKGFNFSVEATGGGSVSYALHHPKEMAEYFVAAIGNVIPAHLSDHGHELLGTVLLLLSAFVFYRCCRESPREGGFPLPACFILFAILFDLSITLGRVSMGIIEALSSRYTMANLLLVIGVAAYFVCQVQRRPLDARGYRPNRAGTLVVALIGVFIIVQAVISTQYGLESGRSDFLSRSVGARVVVNLSEMPPAARPGYVSTYVYRTLPRALPLFHDAKVDKLAMYAPNEEAFYRSLGPPTR